MGRYDDLIHPGVIQYVLANSVREPAILARLREETAQFANAQWQIPPEQGQLMQLLVKMTGARLGIEVGVFSGYSALAVALALPKDGRIVACDISAEFSPVARRYWAEAGVEGKIDLRVAPASETLDSLIAAGGSGKYDFAFIDADKVGYPKYYEQCLTLVRAGGLIALDEGFQDEDAVALRALNKFIHRDERVDALLLPFGDGLTLAVKR